MEDFPKDGTPFLGKFDDFPWTVLCVWNAADDKIVYCNLQCELYHGKWNDYYFENESNDPEHLENWLPLSYLLQ